MALLNQNKVEIIETSRPNPNPKNIEGKATLNGWEVRFSLLEEGNGRLRPIWVVFPENVAWDRVIKGVSSTGHQYYANLAIIQKIESENRVKLIK